MSAENKALISRLCEEINKGNVDFAEQIVDAKRREGAKHTGHMARTVFPDLKLTVDDMIAEGDKVVVRWTARGTHKGEAHHAKMGRIAASGKHVSVSGVTIVRVAGGKIVDTWGVSEEVDALQQLGIIKGHA